MMRHLLDATSEPITWTTDYVALRLICASCATPLLLVGADLTTPERLWHARLDDRLRGNAVQFQMDNADAGAVHLVEVWCQQKRCRGNPRATVATLRRHLDPILKGGRHVIVDLPL